MKFLIIFGRVVGVISFILCVVLLLARFTKPRGYPERLVEDFGTPERIAQLTRLYERVEAAPADEELKLIVARSSWLPREKIGSTRLVPVSWLPADIGIVWKSQGSHGSWGSTLAHYDKDGRLLGIEFHGSRHGAFLSRSTPSVHDYFPTLHIYSQSGLWIVGGYTIGE